MMKKHGKKTVRRKINLRELFRDRIFMKNFFILASIMTAIFLLFALYIYKQSEKLLEKELVQTSKYSLESTAASVDSSLDDARYLLATLETNTRVKAFFSLPDPSMFYNSYYDVMQEYLKAYVNGNTAIDSIYLYSSRSGSVLTDTNHQRLTTMEDSGWLNLTDRGSDRIQAAVRAKKGYYPFLITMIKWYQVEGCEAAIVININIQKNAYLLKAGQSGYQDVYLVTDDSQVVYQYGQNQLMVTTDEIPELTDFDPEIQEYNGMREKNGQAYTYSQLRSSRWKWSYVSVTHSSEYRSRMSGGYVMGNAALCSLLLVFLCFAFMYSLQSVKPIKDLLVFLQSPDLDLMTKQYDKTEIAAIADRIFQIMQNNKALSAELTNRINLHNETKLVALQSQINPHFLFNTLNVLHIQACGALGYDHKLPKVILCMSRLFRYAIDGVDLVPLATELEFTKLYLTILSNQYNDQFKIVYHIHEPCLSALVPKLIIQPLIENAVFHGLAEHMDSNSMLELSCSLDGNTCVIAVRDNGSGMSPEDLNRLRTEMAGDIAGGGSIGLKNVVTRMRLLYGEAFSIGIDCEEGKGSTFTLRFPYRNGKAMDSQTDHSLKPAP